jgi:signal peptidase I
MSKILNLLKQNRQFILFVFVMLFFRSAIADWYHVPSGSMKPTILIGDRVFVNKLAFDMKIPFTDINLNRHGEPERGDVIVFDSKISGNRLIKRVVAIPGDTIELNNNRLIINGEQVKVEKVEYPAVFDHFLNDRDLASYYSESFSNNIPKEDVHTIRIRSNLFSRLSSFSKVSIPTDSYWVMGDNRDNSADSRVIGLVPRDELIGKAESIVISFDKNNYYFPRENRYFVSF